jgi:hypothetical protein
MIQFLLSKPNHKLPEFVFKQVDLSIDKRLASLLTASSWTKQASYVFRFW